MSKKIRRCARTKTLRSIRRLLEIPKGARADAMFERCVHRALRKMGGPSTIEVTIPGVFDTKPIRCKMWPDPKEPGIWNIQVPVLYWKKLCKPLVRRDRIYDKL